MNTKLHSAGRQPLCMSTYTNIYKARINTNYNTIERHIIHPGPHKKASVYPCGLCELPVTWNCQGVCCDDCSISLNTHNTTDNQYKLLNKHTIPPSMTM